MKKPGKGMRITKGKTVTVSRLLNCHGLQRLLKGGKESGLSPLLRRFGTIITMSSRCKKWICDFAEAVEKAGFIPVLQWPTPDAQTVTVWVHRTAPSTCRN